MKSIKLIVIILFLLISQIYAQDNWTPLNSGTAVQINSITFFNPDTGFVVGDFGIILTTINGGKDWTLIEVDTFTTSNRFSPNVFLGKNYNSSKSNTTSMSAILCGDEGTIYRSVNMGFSWTTIPSNTSLNINGLTKYDIPSFFDIVYAVGDSGLILKSTDDGLTWTKQASETAENLNSVAFFNADTGLAVGNNGIILRTINGGVSWIIISIDSTAGGAPAKLKTSKDYNTNRGSNAGRVKYSNITLKRGAVTSGSGIVVGEAGTILRTSDFGLTWSPVYSGTSVSLWGLAAKNSSVTAVGDNGTVLVSSDFGESWQKETSRTNAQLRAVEVAVKATGVNRYAGGSGGALFKAASSQFNIISPSSGDIWYTGSSQTIMWSGGDGGWNVLISLIDWNAWTVYTVLNSNTLNDGSEGWNIPLTIPTGPYQIYIQEVNQLDWKYSGTFTIANPDTSCIPAPSDMVAWWHLDETSGATAEDIAGVPNTGTYFGGPVPVPGKVAGALSFDGADDYVQVADHPELNFGSGDFSIDAWILTNDSMDVGTIVDKRTGTNSVPLGYELYIWNGGLGFQLAAPLGNYQNFNSSAFVADGEWHHIAVTVARNDSSGLKFYVDGNLVATRDPTPYNSSLTNTAVFRIASHSYDQDPNFMFEGIVDELELFNRVLTPAEVQLIWAADSLGKCKPPAVSVNEDQTGRLPQQFLLEQNYPNPFNPVTKIKYGLPKGSFVSITVYDILGRKVKNLVNSSQEAGYKTVIWDGNNEYGKPVSAGIYLYQIRAGDFVQTRKMLFIK